MRVKTIVKDICGPTLRPALQLAFSFIALVGAIGSLVPISSAQDAIVLVGTGSSVPAPLYAQWAEQYNKRSAKIQMRYLALGTSEGINQVSRGSGDFAAGEVLLTSKERSEYKLVQLPAVIIGIVPIYNVPGVQGELRFSGPLLAEIFLGRVKNWNSPAIAKLNPSAALPDLPIKVVYRPAGKGSNYVFTDFLSKTSPQFKEEIGTSASPKWPVGTPAERSADMVEKVHNETGAIGFVEAQYAVKMHIQSASVLNPAGRFVRASEKTLTAACSVIEAPDWGKLSASLVNAPGPDSYPITSFTWLYLRNGSPDPHRVAAVSDLLNWMMREGQQVTSTEGYAELPAPLVENVRLKISSLR